MIYEFHAFTLKSTFSSLQCPLHRTRITNKYPPRHNLGFNSTNSHTVVHCHVSLGPNHLCSGPNMTHKTKQVCCTKMCKVKILKVLLIPHQSPLKSFFKGNFSYRFVGYQCPTGWFTATWKGG